MNIMELLLVMQQIEKKIIVSIQNQFKQQKKISINYKIINKKWIKIKF